MMTASRYEFRVRGRLGEKIAARFQGFDVEVDQSALHGILGQIESLGLELVEVRRVDDLRPEH